MDLISDYNGDFSIAQCKNYIGSIKKEDIDRILEKIISESYELIGQGKITTVGLSLKPALTTAIRPSIPRLRSVYPVQR